MNPERLSSGFRQYARRYKMQALDCRFCASWQVGRFVYDAQEELFIGAVVNEQDDGIFNRHHLAFVC
jgi:hypothetical protein